MILPNCCKSAKPRQSGADLSRVDAANPDPDHRENEEELLDAIIIGAGWAGLAAANTLHRNGITNFKLLEARNHVGGRSITSHEFGEENAVDIGSAWVHGKSSRNPIQALVKQYGLPHAKTGESTVVWDANESSWVCATKMKRMKKLHKGFMKYMWRRQSKDTKDTTLEQVLQDYLAYRKIEPGSENDIALRFMLDAEISQEYAANLSELSLRYWDIDDELPGGDSYLAVGTNGGYSAVVERYAASVMSHIRLQSKVTAVDYGQQHVRVCCVDAASGKEETPICAKHAILTLPLGVLKEGSVRFFPELPISKRESINALGNGLMNKVALYWEDMNASDIFWPKDKEWILLLAPPDYLGISEFYNPYSLDEKSRSLIGFVIGEQARQMEKLSDADMTKEALKSLRRMFGDDKVPLPTKTLVTRWGADEFSRGAYSFQKIGSNGSGCRRDLSLPVNDCLWFAGEATDCKFPSTTHGAFMSGERAGKAVISALMKGT